MPGCACYFCASVVTQVRSRMRVPQDRTCCPYLACSSDGVSKVVAVSFCGCDSCCAKAAENDRSPSPTISTGGFNALCACSWRHDPDLTGPLALPLDQVRMQHARQCFACHSVMTQHHAAMSQCKPGWQHLCMLPVLLQLLLILRALADCWCSGILSSVPAGWRGLQAQSVCNLLPAALCFVLLLGCSLCTLAFAHCTAPLPMLSDDADVC